MGSFHKSLEKWWYGDPPIDQKIFDTIHQEFNVLLYISGLFLDPRPIKWVLTSGILIFNFLICLAYVFFLGVTAKLQMEDFITASQTVHMASVDVVALICMVFMTKNRKHLIQILRTISNKYFDYGDGFVIPEMEEEYRRTKKEKIIIIVVLPTYLAVTALCCMLGRTIDGYFGRASNETYENGVYMLTPEPVWYPFIIENDFTHWFLVATQTIGASALAFSVAGSDAIFVLSCQSLSLQFKILIYRIRKINTCAYRLHRKNGGRRLTKKEIFSDPSFLKYFNLCLNKQAEHHAVLIEQFHHVYEIGKWPTGIALLLGSLLIAMSLLAFAAGGGKPSILALAGFLIVAEVLNIAMICGQSEIVQELGESLHEELYNINWVDADATAKKTIMIMIQRSKRPLVLMAGGLQPLNWESFSAIMNTAYSYVNLLLAADV